MLLQELALKEYLTKHYQVRWDPFNQPHNFTAIESKSFNKIYVSTDIDYVFSEFKNNNSVTLIKRPINLCQDDSSQVDVVNHVFENILLNPKLIKSFVLLQPTSPFKTADEIRSEEMLSNTNVQSVIGVCEVVNHPSDYLFVNSNGKIENLITESKIKEDKNFQNIILTMEHFMVVPWIFL